MKFLKEHLDDDLYAQLSEALKDKDVKLADLSTGEYVSKAKFDARGDELKSLNDQLSERATDIESLQSQLEKVEGVDDLKKQLSDLQGKYEDAQSKHEKQIKSAKASVRAVELGARPEMLKGLMAYVDMDTVSTDDDGALTGFDEQVTAMQETHGDFFGSVKKPQTKLPNPNPQSSGDDWQSKYANAQTTREKVAIKQQAHAEGVIVQ